MALNRDDVVDAAWHILQSYGLAEFADGWRVQGVRLSQPLQDISLPFAVIPTLAAFVGTGGRASGFASSSRKVHASMPG